MAQERIPAHRDTTWSSDAGLHIAFVLLLIGIGLFFALGGAGPFVSGPETTSPSNVEVLPQPQPGSPNINASRRIYVRSA